MLFGGGAHAELMWTWGRRKEAAKRSIAVEQSDVVPEVGYLQAFRAFQEPSTSTPNTEMGCLKCSLQTRATNNDTVNHAHDRIRERGV